MAYAAVRSLENTVNGLIGYSSSETLRSALDHAKSLRYTLEECSALVGEMDEQMMMIEAAIKLEDAIEFFLLSHQPPTFSLDLNHDIHCFVETAKEREQIIEGLWEQKAAKEIEEAIEELFLPKPDPEEEEDVEMVGLCDQFLQIRDKVLAAHEFNHSWDRVIWISGMAGIGKTALAKKVFHDPLVKTVFQSLVFVRVGLKFWSAERILQAIRDQLNLDNRGMTQNFLLFLDDVWDYDLIQSLYNRTQLGKEKGIVILLTSRTDKTYYPYFSVKVRFMNEEESWELLRRKVFGEEEYCPPQLVKAGKKIAEKCEGLPLLINTVAPILLSKAQKDPERWNRVAHKPDSILEEASHQISQMGDCSVEVTEENREAAQLAKSMAMDAILEGELDKAISHLTEAIVLNPKSAMLYASRAHVFVKLKKPNAAIRDADAALKIDGDLGKGYKARGMAKARLGLWEIAARDLQMASKLDFDEEATVMLEKEAHEFASLLKEGIFHIKKGQRNWIGVVYLTVQ